MHSPINMAYTHSEASKYQLEILLFHASHISYIEELFSLFLKIFHQGHSQDCGRSDKTQVCPTCSTPMAQPKAFVYLKESTFCNASTKHVTIFTHNLLNHCITINVSNIVLKYWSIFHNFSHLQLYVTIKDGCLILSRACSFSCFTSLLRPHFDKFLW